MLITFWNNQGITPLLFRGKKRPREREAKGSKTVSKR